ncbi:hypothetical protein Tco_0806166 [Tanacetum coccineum]
MHVVPLPMTGNYMPSGPDIEIYYSQFTYGPKQSQTSESETQTSDFDTCESYCSVETHESLPEPTVNEPKVVSQPKVWSDAPIIEEYESDSEDEHVSLPTEEHETPSFANQQVLPPRTAEEILAKERERKARTTLLMALPEDHLAKFHKMTDAKEMWEAIRSRFGGNDESKKMQKYILKQQFEGFSVSNSEGLHKGYDRFQSLLSQLEIHGAGVSTEDANQKFLRSPPSAWSQVSHPQNFTTTQRNTTMGCYFIVHTHKSQKTTPKETFK